MARLSLLSVFALLALLVMASVSEARTPGNAGTRDLQEKLSLLGYDPGPVDGSFGPKTRAAVKAFQTDAEIKIDGVVGRETRKALDDALDMSNRKPRQANIQLDVYEDVLTDRLADEGSITLPGRYQKTVLSKLNAGRFTVLVGESVISTSPGYRSMPRISRPFELPGEDVYLLSSYSARKACKVEHHLLVVRKDGSHMPPTAIGNCLELLNARTEGSRVVFSFPPTENPSWRLDDSWIYFNGKIEQR